MWESWGSLLLQIQQWKLMLHHGWPMGCHHYQGQQLPLTSEALIVSFCFPCHLFWTICSPIQFTGTLDASDVGCLCAMCFRDKTFLGHIGAFNTVGITWLNPASCLHESAPRTSLQGPKHIQVQQLFLAPKHHKVQCVLTPTQAVLHWRQALRNPHHTQQEKSPVGNCGCNQENKYKWCADGLCYPSVKLNLCSGFITLLQVNHLQVCW